MLLSTGEREQMLYVFVSYHESSISLRWVPSLTPTTRLLSDGSCFELNSQYVPLSCAVIQPHICLFIFSTIKQPSVRYKVRQLLFILKTRCKLFIKITFY